MSAVDVLAVMDDAAHALNCTRTAPERIALLEARAAVAELIEAAEYMAQYTSNYSALTYSPTACAEANDRLLDALARVQGGAA